MGERLYSLEDHSESFGFYSEKSTETGVNRMTLAAMIMRDYGITARAGAEMLTGKILHESK